MKFTSKGAQCSAKKIGKEEEIDDVMVPQCPIKVSGSLTTWINGKQNSSVAKENNGCPAVQLPSSVLLQDSGRDTCHSRNIKDATQSPL